MIGRILPLLGTLLVSRAGRKVAGRHAGKLVLAVGLFELWRNYQRARPTPGPQTGPQTGPADPRTGDPQGRSSRKASASRFRRF